MCGLARCVVHLFLCPVTFPACILLCYALTKAITNTSMLNFEINFYNLKLQYMTNTLTLNLSVLLNRPPYCRTQQT